MGRSDRYTSRGCFARCGAQDPFLCLSGISVKVCLSPAHLTMTSPTHPSPHPPNLSLNPSPHSPVHPSSYLRTCTSPYRLTCPTHLLMVLHSSSNHASFSIHHPPTHPSIQPSTHPPTHLPTHPCMHSPKHLKPTHPSTHSSITHPPYTDLSTYHPTIHPPVHKSIHSSFHPLIHLLPICSFISPIDSIHSMYPFAHHPPHPFSLPLSEGLNHTQRKCNKTPTRGVHRLLEQVGICPLGGGGSALI